MNVSKFNWQIWLGFFISVFALLSYPLIFVQWPLTRDFPWVNILLFVIAEVFIFVGIRRAFGTDRGMALKIGAVLLAGLSTLVLVGFIMVAFVSSTWMPAAAAAPTVGSKASEFALVDSGGTQVSLTELRTEPIGSMRPIRGVLLIFYRGYW